MPLDVQRLQSAQLTRRTESVPVPELRDYFDDGEPAVWIVRQLDANAVALINQAEQARSLRDALAAAMEAGGPPGEITDGVRDMLGAGPEAVSPIYVRQLKAVELGSVEPACDEELAKHMATHHPIKFREIFDAIMRCTGLGSEAGKKPRHSGATTESATS